MLLGIDVGGTKVSGVVLNANGRVIAADWSEHDASGIDDVASLIAATVEVLMSRRVVDTDDLRFGISMAGLVGADGLVTREGRLSLVRADVAAAVERRSGLRGLVVNDAEATLIAAIDRDPQGALVTDAVLLALGTGVGGAVWWQGQLLRGRHGFAGELGHLPVRRHLDYRCVCGGLACLEQFASGRGLSERANALAQLGLAAELLEVAGSKPGELTSHDVVAAAQTGERTALILLDDAAAALAEAVVAISVVSEPSNVYIGGSLGHGAGDLLLPRLASQLDDRWPFATTWPAPDVALDQVGRHAAAVGAALFASHADTT